MVVSFGCHEKRIAFPLSLGATHLRFAHKLHDIVLTRASAEVTSNVSGSFPENYKLEILSAGPMFEGDPRRVEKPPCSPTERLPVAMYLARGGFSSFVTVRASSKFLESRTSLG